jgi:hypothetical protein
MKKRAKAGGLLACMVLAFLLTMPVVAHASGEKVAVIAPSVSTSIEARSIMRRFGWVQTNLREAQFILVVVKSILFYPLNYSYGSIKELQDDADMQLNIIGENFHIYIYQINDDLSVTELKHTSYKAHDY